MRLWDATSGAWKQTLEGHSSSVPAVAFSPVKVLVSTPFNRPDNREWVNVIASASYDGTLTVLGNRHSRATAVVFPTL